MKITFHLALLSLFTTACSAPSAPPADGTGADSAQANNRTRAVNTYVYKGTFPNAEGKAVNGAMFLSMADGDSSGTFVYAVAPEGTTSGQAVRDSGRFTTQRTDHYGDVYVMQGARQEPYYFQALDNKLIGVDQQLGTTTSEVLVGVDPTSAATARTGGDADAHGCRASAGYTWSRAQRACVRLWEAGIVLKPVQDAGSYTAAATAILDPAADTAEVFLPNDEPRLLPRKGGSATAWADGALELVRVQERYVLRVAGKDLYRSE